MASTAPTTLESQLRSARSELETALRAGRDLRSEELLAARPELAADAESAIELVYTEFVVRQDLGQAPAPADWYARFPRWRADLEQMFQVHDVLCKADHSNASLSRSELLRSMGVGDGGPVTVPGFEILEEVGRGGMGVVYKARQVKLNRVVALKVILSGEHAAAKERLRFRREAEAAARLDHPNIVRVIEIGEYGGRLFCTMEYVRGGPLSKRITGSPWPFRTAADLVSDVAKAADHAHQRGVVHRDLKPSNILLADADASPADPADQTRTFADPAAPPGRPAAPLVPKIVDFGLAKCRTEDHALTRTGDVVGTPMYMAPEQADGKADVGPAVDVWALGVVLYELLTGHPPFQGESAAETLLQVKTAEPVAPRLLRPKLPRDLDTICLKCLQKDPKARYATARDLAGDLDRWLMGLNIVARPVSAATKVGRWCRRNPAVTGLLALLAVVTLAGVGSVVWLWRDADQGRADALTAWTKEAAARDRAIRLSAREADARGEAEAQLYASRIAQAAVHLAASRTLAAEQILDDCLAKNPDQCGWEWGYLKRQCHTHVVEMVGHTQQVNSTAYSPDGALVASGAGFWNGTDPGEVKLWDAATGKLVRTLTGPTRTVHRVAFHPDGDWVAAAGLDGTVWRWDPRDAGKTFAPIPCGSPIYAIAVHPSGRWMAAALASGTVAVIDLTTARTVGRFPAHVGHAFDVAYSPDGTCLASAGRDGRVVVRATDTDRVLQTLYHPGDARRVAFSGDNRYLVSGSFDGAVKLWERANDYRLAFTHALGMGNLLNLAFRPDTTQLACCTVRTGLRVWRMQGQEDLFPAGTAGGSVHSVAYSPDARWIACARDDHVIRVWDTAPAGEPRLTAHNTWVAALSFRPDGKALAVAGGVNWSNHGLGTPNVRVLGYPDGKVLANLPAHAASLTSVAYRPDGKQVIAGDRSGAAVLWNVETRTPDRTLRHDGGAVTGVACHPTAGRAATAGENGAVCVWDLATGERVAELRHPNAVLCVAYSSDGRLLATGGADQVVRVWDAETGAPLHALAGHAAAVNAIAFRPNAETLATADETQALRFWDARAGRALSAHPFERAPATETKLDAAPDPRPTAGRRETYLSFSTDGRRLAVAGARGSTQVWDAQAQRLLLTVGDDEAGLNRVVAFTPAGRQLLSANRWFLNVWESEAPDARGGIAGAAAGLDRWRQAMLTDHWNARAWGAAEFYADHLLRLQPDAAWAARRGAARAALGRAAEADADHERAIELAIAGAATERAERLALWHVWNWRGEGLAYARRWPAAVAAHREAARYAADVALNWCNVAEAHLAGGDEAAFRDTARDILARFGGTKQPATAAMVLQVAVTTPTDADAKALLRLADLVVPAAAGNERLKGAALYRVGQYRAAMEQLDAAQRAFALRNRQLRAWDMLFRAMACHRLNRPAEAREWLARAGAWIDEADRVARTPTAWSDFAWGEWNEEVEARALFAEATALVLGRPPSPWRVAAPWTR